ncbi:hypothetical protein CW685_08245 [Macrococcoides caseolyticum]|nr:hypothetical protein CW685_08245 [Macrococcus caseolyticus]
MKNEELLKELNRFGLNFRSVPEVMEYLQNNQNKIDIEVDQILKKHTEKLMKIYYGKKGMETFLF